MTASGIPLGAARAPGQVVIVLRAGDGTHALAAQHVLRCEGLSPPHRRGRILLASADRARVPPMRGLKGNQVRILDGPATVSG